MRVIFFLTFFVTLVGCANQSVTKSTPPVSIKKWEYKLEVDDFTERKTCVVRYIEEYSSDIGLERDKTLSITSGPMSNASSFLMVWEERESLRSFDPDFGMINKGPYTPWPKLRQDADVRVGDVVGQALLISSTSTARDVYTRGIWERSTKFSLPADVINKANETETLSVRIGRAIYKVPTYEFQEFRACAVKI